MRSEVAKRLKWLASVPAHLRHRAVRWLLRDVRLPTGRFGDNTITLSPSGVGDVVRWSGSKAAVALGDIGMDTATGRPSIYVGGAARAVAHTGDVSGGGYFSKVGTNYFQSSGTGGQSSITFSSLTGDTDGGWLLWGRVRLVSNHDKDVSINLRPNNTALSAQDVSMRNGARSVYTSTNVQINDSAAANRTTIARARCYNGGADITFLCQIHAKDEGSFDRPFQSLQGGWERNSADQWVFTDYRFSGVAAANSEWTSLVLEAIDEGTGTATAAIDDYTRVSICAPDML